MSHAPARVHVRQEIGRTRRGKGRRTAAHEDHEGTTAGPRIQLPVVPRTALRSVRIRQVSPSDVLLAARLVQTRPGRNRVRPAVRIDAEQPVQIHVLQCRLFRQGVEDAIHGTEGTTTDATTNGRRRWWWWWCTAVIHAGTVQVGIVRQ